MRILQELADLKCDFTRDYSIDIEMIASQVTVLYKYHLNSVGPGPAAAREGECEGEE